MATSTILVLACTREISSDGSDLEQALASSLQRAYDEITNDPENYAQSVEHVVSGQTNTESILRIASGWNQVIREELRTVMDNLQKAGFRLDSQETYQLTKAAAIANIEFHPYASRLLFNMPNSKGEPSWVFSSVLTDAQLADIQTNPETYLLAELSVK